MIKKYNKFLKEGIEIIKKDGKIYDFKSGYAFVEAFGNIYFSDYGETHSQAMTIAILDKKNYRNLGFYYKPIYKDLSDFDKSKFDNSLFDYMYLKGRFFRDGNIIVIDYDSIINENTFKNNLIKIENILNTRFSINTSITVLEFNFMDTLIEKRFLLKEFIEKYSNELLKNVDTNKYSNSLNIIV